MISTLWDSVVINVNERSQKSCTYLIYTLFLGMPLELTKHVLQINVTWPKISLEAGQSAIYNCYLIAGIFSPTARALIGYFEVT